MLKDRFFSFAMVLGTGFLLLTSLILSTAVVATFGYLGGIAPGLKPMLAVGDTGVSAIVVTLLFALIYKILPDAKIAWRDVWVGAALTTALFLVGKALIGAYLGRSSYGSAYGAAGSVVVLLVWIYYSSQILASARNSRRFMPTLMASGSNLHPMPNRSRLGCGSSRASPRTCRVLDMHVEDIM